MVTVYYIASQENNLHQKDGHLDVLEQADMQTNTASFTKLITEGLVLNSAPKTEFAETLKTGCLILVV